MFLLLWNLRVVYILIIVKYKVRNCNTRWISFLKFFVFEIVLYVSMVVYINRILKVSKGMNLIYIGLDI